MIAKAMQKVGNEGVITIEEAKSLETELDVVEGMQFDRGYLSPYFVTNAEKMICELDEPYILLHEKKLSALHERLALSRRAWAMCGGTGDEGEFSIVATLEAVPMLEQAIELAEGFSAETTITKAEARRTIGSQLRRGARGDIYPRNTSKADLHDRPTLGGRRRTVWPVRDRCTRSYIRSYIRKPKNGSPGGQFGPQSSAMFRRPGCYDASPDSSRFFPRGFRCLISLPALDSEGRQCRRYASTFVRERGATRQLIQLAAAPSRTSSRSCILWLAPPRGKPWPRASTPRSSERDLQPREPGQAHEER